MRGFYAVIYHPISLDNTGVVNPIKIPGVTSGAAGDDQEPSVIAFELQIVSAKA